MRKYQKAAVVMAMLGSVSFLGAGVSQAHGGDGFKVDNTQTNACGNESVQGVLNISRLNVQALDILANQPVDQSIKPVCANGFGG
ncbi:hypothetical protein [Streptomyces sp. NPDC001315]|uniref:hypothetical protein n=1 Tax=Streptomyces sp. NPDC001315 TaxID=3364562 RepID=UPI0036A38FAD